MGAVKPHESFPFYYLIYSNSIFIFIFFIFFFCTQPEATYIKRFNVSAGRAANPAGADNTLKRVRRAMTLESTITYLGRSLNGRSVFTIVADDATTSAELEGELEQSRSLLKQQSTFVAKMVRIIHTLHKQARIRIHKHKHALTHVHAHKYALSRTW